MIALNLCREPLAIRGSNERNTIGDNLRILAAANLLNGCMSLSSAKRCAKTLKLDIPFWSWDEVVEKFAANGRTVQR